MRGKVKDKPLAGTGTVPSPSVAVNESVDAGIANSGQVVEVLPGPWPPFSSTLELAADSIVKGNLAMARLLSGDYVAVRKVADAGLTEAASRFRASSTLRFPRPLMVQRRALTTESLWTTTEG